MNKVIYISPAKQLFMTRFREIERKANGLLNKRVISRYRARWSGTVLQHFGDGIVEVLVDTDKCGRPMRKPFKKRINSGWLEEIKKV